MGWFQFLVKKIFPPASFEKEKMREEKKYTRKALLVVARDFKELSDGLAQHALGERANLAMDDFPARDEQHGWDALDAIFLRPFRVVIGVDFGNDYFPGIFLGQLVEDGGYHFAWTAPRGPKINDHRGRRLQDGFFKGRIGYMERGVKHN
jgi:hypothetical protein